MAGSNLNHHNQSRQSSIVAGMGVSTTAGAGGYSSAHQREVSYLNNDSLQQISPKAAGGHHNHHHMLVDAGSNNGNGGGFSPDHHHHHHHHHYQ